MNQESWSVSKPRAMMSKTLIVCILILAFGTLSIFGNYVQWTDAVKTSAEILTAKEQWVRRGSNYLKLQVRYDVDGKSVQGEVYAMPDDLGANSCDGGIDVVYKRKNPSDVISAAILQDKRRSIPWIICAGLVLTAVGLYRQFGQRLRESTEKHA
jgi:hypothetical protein